MSLFDERCKNLNAEQKRAVDTIDGPLLVIAGPGSGKTEMLSLRVANIRKETDTDPRSILCLTFADAAAANMRERLAELIGRDAYRVAIHTFHGFGVEVINRYPEYFYNGATFSSADAVTQIEILEGIFKELAYDNPIRKEHPEQGFTYMNDAKSAIGELKKAGITPDEFEKMLKANEESLKEIGPSISVFDSTISKKQIPVISGFAESMGSYKKPFPSPRYDSLPRAVGRSLETTLAEVHDMGINTPLSEWKKDHTAKDDGGKRVLRESLYIEKLVALCEVYREYVKRMHDSGYYDFEDMLLDVLGALDKNPSLRYDLQEQYQYILVDEFQDTNGAQMRLLGYLTDALVHDGKPNIMAVGDDDQAIYKFQGADGSNILDFKKMFPKSEIVSLVKNYRSHQDILDLARHIILKGGGRLETSLKISKNLIAAGTDPTGGIIASKTFPTHEHEYYWIAEKIAKHIVTGDDPEKIAVIARHHSDLHDLQPYLDHRKIPVAYERQRNVLQYPFIRQVIQIARFADSLGRKNHGEADEYLPEILSFPFWGIDRKTIWELSVRADEQRKSKVRRRPLWIETMLSFHDERVRQIAEFLLDLGNRAKHEPMEYVLDAIIGSKGPLLPDSEDEDDAPQPIIGADKFISPFRSYYFSKKRFRENKGDYLTFLSGLRVFVHALREYRGGEFVKIEDLVRFVDVHEKNKIPITDQSSFVSAGKAVHLLSAHGAKGLQFDTVFVVHCEDKIWAHHQRGTRLPFPSNLPIAPAGDMEDDQLRLFYVAITRAKRNLFLTSSEKTGAEKASARLRFLVPSENEVLKKNVKAALEIGEGESATGKSELTDGAMILTASFEHSNRAPYLSDEAALLRTLVKDYQLSVTHLNNFLNLKDGGPEKFLEQNLLRFPGAKSASASYGSAMHEGVEFLGRNLKERKKIPALKELLEWFRDALAAERLAKADFKRYERQGTAALTKFYEAKKGEFALTDRIEARFKTQGVVVGEAHLDGQIDRMVFTGSKEVEVHDFKTGNVAEEWGGDDPHEKVKLHNYRRQLLFYKLLVENSREFGGKYTVRRGVLEFLEPEKDRIIDLSLDIEDKEVERTRGLIDVVYRKIQLLDFPDVSKYSEDLRGIIAFEDDLLSGAI